LFIAWSTSDGKKRQRQQQLLEFVRSILIDFCFDYQVTGARYPELKGTIKEHTP
jgi:hypothetical protein